MAGEEKASAGGGASCELPATFMWHSNNMLMKDLMRQKRRRSQVQVLSKGIIFAKLSLSCLKVMPEYLYQDFLSPISFKNRTKNKTSTV